MRVAVAAVLLFLAVPSSADVPVVKLFPVTNTNDDGSGSLRAAIETVNASCDGTVICRITFQIPGPGPWHTIRPARPLPQLLAPNLQIDGESQKTTGGDTNALGPEIELNGSLVEEGNGLDLRGSCYPTVIGLAINGFPSNGILLGGHSCGSGVSGTIAANYIGCDPTGSRAVPNARGIWVDSPRALHYNNRIERNVISGNRYSGIFVGSGPQLIHSNVIGLTATLDGPLPNGASGVAVLEKGSGTDVNENVIGFNHHFGIGLERGTTTVGIEGNSFQGNRQLAIDYGMDGVSPHGVISIPEITNARYENGDTIVEIRVNESLGTFPRIYVYANDAPDPSGYGEGQYFLGLTGSSSSSDRQFTFRHAGDLRGKWVTATAMQVHYYGWLRTNGERQGFATTSSEFSRAVEVK